MAAPGRQNGERPSGDARSGQIFTIHTETNRLRETLRLLRMISDAPTYDQFNRQQARPSPILVEPGE